MPSRAFPGPGTQRAEPRAVCSWCLFSLLLASCTAASAPEPVDGDVHDIEHPSTSSDGGEASDATPPPEPLDAMSPWSDAAIDPVERPCAAERLDFTSGWSLQSSAQLSVSGAEISSVGFSTAGWHSTRVPATVLSALVADGTYPD